MAPANGVPVPECVAAIRHLAPYVGYPTAAVALQQLQQLGTSGGRVPRESRRSRRAGRHFAEFFTNRFNQRWNSGDLSPRERALACLAADVLNQTLDESFRCTRISRRPPQINAVLLLLAEFGIAKAWRAYQARATR